MSERWWRKQKRLDPWSNDLDKESDQLENISEQYEPLVDVFEEEKEVVIVAELPGVRKEDVLIHATKDNVNISVDTLECKYHKGIALPVDTKPGSAVATYRNGVLQMRLKKLLATQPFTM